MKITQSLFIFFFFKILSGERKGERECVCVHGYVYGITWMWQSGQLVLVNQFFPSTLWDLRVELISSDLVAHAFTQGAIPQSLQSHE